MPDLTDITLKVEKKHKYKYLCPEKPIVQVLGSIVSQIIFLVVTC